jgi:hypothetical protein
MTFASSPKLTSASTNRTHEHECCSRNLRTLLRCAFLHRLLLCRRTTNQGCERLLELKAIMSLWEFSSVACVTTDLTTTTATTRTATTVMPTTTTNTTGMIIACGSDPGQLFYSNSIESVQQLRRRLGNTSIQKCLNYTALQSLQSYRQDGERTIVCRWNTRYILLCYAEFKKAYHLRDALSITTAFLCDVHSHFE